MITKEQKITLKNKAGVYILINKENGKTYIGSSYDIPQRIHNHRYALRKNKHRNIILQRSFNAYGEEAFIFDILEFCDKEIIQIREQYYLNQFKPELNIAKDTKAPMRGLKHSPESISKMTGREPWNRGIARTEEEKLNMSKGKKREWLTKTNEYKKWFSEIHKTNPSRYWLGKKVPEHVAQHLINFGKSIRQKIRCIQTGEIFDAQIDAAKKYKIKQGHISEQLNGKRASAGGYTFERVDDVA